MKSAQNNIESLLSKLQTATQLDINVTSVCYYMCGKISNDPRNIACLLAKLKIEIRDNNLICDGNLLVSFSIFSFDNKHAMFLGSLLILPHMS